MICPDCGGSDFEMSTLGDYVCADCGQTAPEYDPLSHPTDYEGE